ncbi:MAG: hypothetical protein ABII07_02520 [Patescibacteria group bacterium]|nr:hypothetical protein [Patescibacteria group bacterium]
MSEKIQLSYAPGKYELYGAKRGVKSFVHDLKGCNPQEVMLFSKKGANPEPPSGEEYGGKVQAWVRTENIDGASTNQEFQASVRELTNSYYNCGPIDTMVTPPPDHRSEGDITIDENGVARYIDDPTITWTPVLEVTQEQAEKIIACLGKELSETSQVITEKENELDRYKDLREEIRRRREQLESIIEEEWGDEISC